MKEPNLILYPLAVVCFILVFIIMSQVMVPKIQEWAAPEVKTYPGVFLGGWGTTTEELNQLLEEGWTVTGFESDSCLNVTVTLER